MGVRVKAPSAAIRPMAAFENGLVVWPLSAMCQTCSTGGGGGGVIGADCGAFRAHGFCIGLAIAMPMLAPSPAPIAPDASPP
jgi:hypothetical protein